MRYNIVVMPSSQDSMHRYSLSKFTLVFLEILFSLIILSAAASIVGGLYVYNQKRNVESINKNLVDKNNQLVDYQKELDVEIKQVREMEQKIRGVFGLKKPEEATDATSSGLLGQGGFDSDPYEDSGSIVSDSVIQADFITNELDGDLPLIDKIKYVKSSIKDVYDYAVDKEEDYACMPSVNPVQKGQFWITSDFGWRIHPLTNKRQFHHGLDISARRGSEISAPADGEIILIREYPDLGKSVKIKHDSKYTTRYGHLKNYAKGLRIGQKVKRYDVIGYMGRTGRTTGTHLHYEVHVNGKIQDPEKYILDRKVN